MATRDELSGLTIEIKMRMATNPRLKITDIPRVRELAAKTPLYLIDCTLPGGTKYFSVKSKEEINKVPPGFMKPAGDVEFYWFKGGEQDAIMLLELGLL
jgi:hypothetical protein